MNDAQRLELARLRRNLIESREMLMLSANRLQWLVTRFPGDEISAEMVAEEAAERAHLATWRARCIEDGKAFGAVALAAGVEIVPMFVEQVQ